VISVVMVVSVLAGAQLLLRISRRSAQTVSQAGKQREQNKQAHRCRQEWAAEQWWCEQAQVKARLPFAPLAALASLPSQCLKEMKREIHQTTINRKQKH